MPTTLTTLCLCNIPWNNDVSNDVVGTVVLCKKIQSKVKVFGASVLYYEMNDIHHLPCCVGVFFRWSVQVQCYLARFFVSTYEMAHPHLVAFQQWRILRLLNRLLQLGIVQSPLLQQLEILAVNSLFWDQLQLLARH